MSPGLDDRRNNFRTPQFADKKEIGETGYVRVVMNEDPGKEPSGLKGATWVSRG